MQQIKNKGYEGERPLFARHDLQLDNVTIHTGESALKECSNIIAVNCRFEGKYPFWHTNGFVVKNCFFTEGARAALWYSHNLHMTDTVVEAPKMFREMDGIRLENVQLLNALETFWHCRNVELKNVQIDKADYWNTENVTVYNSELNGEYLGWHSHNLRLVNCKISGTQALCYAHDLVMENCVMTNDSDLCFEFSTVQATINSPVHSVKNPRSGRIVAESFGEIILNDSCKAPTNCELRLWNERNSFSA